ncbi:MAG: hypothetical protein LBG68_00950 [Coriobacteriales bacterium]|jgi:hypothetical protein|nr:hypothetical protein [Coriobacteriales bacterium]
MRKTSQPSSDRETKREGSSNQVLSFIGGLVFVALIVGYTISQNQRLREELELQLKSALEVSKGIITQISLVVDSVNSISQWLKVDQGSLKTITNMVGASSLANNSTALSRITLGTDARDNTLDLAEESITATKFEESMYEYEQFWLQLDRKMDSNKDNPL